uniref:Eukaryotic translation initiation factor 3 subunit H n=1 Tax=Aplanochytrium stocchinoi TaxID=215587 RepID=A0A7S3LS17_9STRA|mmetsp:Transcript_1791/g.2697  ORF Transcript_1791/g.2697 Transcript_1791/m.2697 type:complete len:407 (-) Transcript_1791:118-1338(-)
MWQRGVTPQGRSNFGDQKKGGYQQQQHGAQVRDGAKEGKGQQGQQRGSYTSRAYKQREQKGRQKLAAVKVDGLVVLKIIKHCSDSLPEFCAGSLLGLDVDKKLEVTNCFPFPDADDDEGDGTEYQLEMMKLLRDVNVDNNCVGWYRSTNMGSFCTSDLVEQQFNYQETLDQGEQFSKSVALIYDPYQTKKGHLALKAYRLTDEFVQMYREAKSGTANAAQAAAEMARAAQAALLGETKNLAKAIPGVERFLQEIPIEITNSHYVHVYLRDIAEEKGDGLDTQPDRLDLSTDPYLEKNLEYLVDEVDNLEAEQHKMQYHQRQIQKQQQQQQKWLQQRRMENKAREEHGEPLLPEEGDPNNPIFKPMQNPSKLESLLIRNQIGVYCDQINQYSGASFSKLYLASGIQK